MLRLLCAFVFLLLGLPGRTEVMLYSISHNPAEDLVLREVKSIGLRITQKEFDRYLKAEGIDQSELLSEERAAQALEALTDEHLIALDALKSKLVVSAEVQNRRAITRQILAMQRLGEKVSEGSEDESKIERRLQQLGSELFAAADIQVDGTLYKRLQEVSQRLHFEATLHEIAADESAVDIPWTYHYDIAPQLLAEVLAFNEATGREVSFGEVMEQFLTRPSLVRPDLSDATEFENFLAQFFTEPLLYLEAYRRGLHGDPWVIAHTDRIMNHYLFVLQLEAATMERAAEELDALSDDQLQEKLGRIYDEFATTRFYQESTDAVLPFEDVADSLQADLWSHRVEELSTQYKASLREKAGLSRSDIVVSRDY